VNPHVEGADILSILETPKLSKWSDEEHHNFVNAVRLYGKDFTKITEAVGGRSKHKVQNYAHNLKQRFFLNPEHEDADILPILEGPAQTYNANK